jgi:hypothetical protein
MRALDDAILFRVQKHIHFNIRPLLDRLYGLVVRFSGYRSRGPASIPGTTIFSEKGSQTASTQPGEYN